MPEPGFAEQIEPEIATLYRVATRLTLHREDAEDLVGQTLLQAARAWPRFDGQHLRSWLIRILRNAYFNSMRQPRSALLPPTVASKDDVQQMVGDRLIRDTILNELDKLPLDYRMAITLCDLEELSYREAAQSLDIPIGTLQSRVFRGRKMLQERLEGHIETKPLRLGRTSNATT